MFTVIPMFALYTLFKLITVSCYTYQTEPLFPSVSDLEDVVLTAGGEHKVKTFVVKCHEDGIEVVIRASLFDPALPVEPTHLRLGPVSAARDHCRASESANGDYVMRAALGDCGSLLMFTAHTVLYDYLLLFSPPSSPEDPFQMEGAAVGVQCQYKRRYTVSSRALKPTWIPSVSVQSSQLNLDFHLRLMTNDWSTERKSSVYFLGEMVNIEASVDRHNRHLPLRLYVDSCVATLSSDATSHPRHPFIDHQGCFTDSKLNGSRSRFLSRVQDNLLQIQLAPLLFHQDDRQTIYITCYLEAEPVSNKKPEKKACSFRSGSWRSVDGDHHVCEVCESDHSSTAASSQERAPRSKTDYREFRRETTLPPVTFLPWKR